MPIREIAKKAVDVLAREYGERYDFGKPEPVELNSRGHTFNATIRVTPRYNGPGATHEEMEAMAAAIKARVKVDQTKMPVYEDTPSTHTCSLI